MTFSAIFQYAYFAALAFSAFTDVIEKKIYNWITFPLAALGLVFHIGTAGFSGLSFSLMGLGAGLLLYLPLYMTQIVGAGDVKLLAAIGAYTGTFTVFDIGLGALLIGGAIGITLLLAKRKMLPTFFSFFDTLLHTPKVAQSTFAPFGPAIFIAAVVTQAKLFSVLEVFIH